MHEVRPKKFLGQHFLKDQNIARKIVDALTPDSDKENIVEIGPGTGVLTKYLIEKDNAEIILVEIDKESVSYLRKHFQLQHVKIVEGDFLKIKLSDLFNEEMSIIGNFPYNISSQIFFHIIDHRDLVKEVVCMIQKEVANRICSPHGNKIYGILSVLIGAYYDAEKLFNVSPGVFVPPPKVDSAVIRLKRKAIFIPDCDEELFRKIVKQGFQNRRKTLRNALKPILLPAELMKDSVFDNRAEQLSVADFINLTKMIQQWKM
jgi:16S rRNA (adenine1518-N6/adenine1519-N6)-dimethyltransferase